ncbi:conserved hypothetical protein [Trichinella spiralis]|uniref:hypothetical protein n=1 Tax=Trichinella spiralis TaxID=6334 RepID=UPI0001EFE156|nr:conserved hypothetical protein [Trichinella spiralis]
MAFDIQFSGPTFTGAFLCCPMTEEYNSAAYTSLGNSRAVQGNRRLSESSAAAEQARGRNLSLFSALSADYSEMNHLAGYASIFSTMHDKAYICVCVSAYPRIC